MTTAATPRNHDGATSAGAGGQTAAVLLIDRPAFAWRGRLWSHLISDSSLAELHEFARSVGLRYASFGLDHYDVPENLFPDMVAAGAVEVDARDIVRRLRAAGLRERRGKHLRTWAPGSLVDPTVRGEVEATADLIAARVPDDMYVLERPDTQLVMFEVMDEVRVAAGPDVTAAVRTVAPTATPVITVVHDELLVVELVYGRF